MIKGKISSCISHGKLQLFLDTETVANAFRALSIEGTG